MPCRPGAGSLGVVAIDVDCDFCSAATVRTCCCPTQDGGGSISADELADLMETLGIHAKKVSMWA